MNQFPEIEHLKSYFKKHIIGIKKHVPTFREDFYSVELSIDGYSWSIYIDDEYRDFSADNSLVCLFLVLNALETFQESKDYLSWCREYQINASDMSFLNYYEALGSSYQEIEIRLGKIDSGISSYDYQMRTGVVQALINENE